MPQGTFSRFALTLFAKSYVSKANGAICEYLLVTRELLKQRSGT